MHNDLCQHRVVVAADRHSGNQTGIHPNTRSTRFDDRQHRPPGGQEACRRVLGVHPGLDRVAVHHDVVLAGRQPLPRSDAYLPLHQVPSGDHLGDRMLHLKPGVHFHEEELLGAVGGDDELHRAGSDIVDAAGGIAGCSADPGPGRGVEQRRRRLLDDLLMATLQAALTLAEMKHRTVGVGEHLNLNVPGAQDEPLEEQGVVAECRTGLAP